MAREERKAQLKKLIQDIRALELADLREHDLDVLRRAATLKENELGYVKLEAELEDNPNVEPI